MGAALWVAAGVVAFVIARIIPIRRRERWIPEAVVAVAIAAVAGIVATFLDFGGWNEPDWRAVIFSFLLAAAALGVLRAIQR